MLNELDNLYAFKDRDLVRCYLRDKPELVKLLIESHHEIMSVFDECRYVELDLLKDMDYDDLVVFAYVYLDASISVVDALGKLSMIDEKLLFDKARRMGYRFNYDVTWLNECGGRWNEDGDYGNT